MQLVWNLFFMIGGVAAMMLGMKLMGGGLEKFAGGKMKVMLGKITTNRFAGVGVGVAVTSIIQSSTATTVMLVGFVNVGLMTLAQAANVIMGANIGTTITAHIVSLSGVGGGVDIGAIASMIGCGGVLVAMLVKNERIATIGNILGGLGMVFVGLEVISTYAKLIMFVESGVPHPFVEKVFRGDHFPLLLVLIGIVLTALVHSSSTITSLMVVLASIDVLSFKNALFLALGSNIGTCLTSVMSSIGTHVNARRTAIIHLLFNTVGCLIFIAPLWIWGNQVTNLFASMSDDVGQQIAIFHTLFNLATTILMFPFIQWFVKLVCILIPEDSKKQKEKDDSDFTFIDERLFETPAVAVSNTKFEIIKMATIAKENLNLCMHMLYEGKEINTEKFENNERTLNALNKKITSYLTKLIGLDLSENEDQKVGTYYHVVSDIERVGDYAENVVEYTAKLKNEDLKLSDEAIEELKVFTKTINDLFDVSIRSFDERNVSLLEEVDKIESSIDEMCAALEVKHVDRLKKGLCTAQIGSVYLQTISNLERVADHITNVAFSIKKYSV